jgi:hypothetical protein
MVLSRRAVLERAVTTSSRSERSDNHRVAGGHVDAVRLSAVGEAVLQSGEQVGFVQRSRASASVDDGGRVDLRLHASHLAGGRGGVVASDRSLLRADERVLQVQLQDLGTFSIWYAISRARP